MEKKISKTDDLKADKESVLNDVKNLIRDERVKLNTKYLHSHNKVALFYQGHVIEIIGGAEKQVKYLSLAFPLTVQEHNEIFMLFMDEVKKRKDADSLRKLFQLRSLINN